MLRAVNQTCSISQAVKSNWSIAVVEPQQARVVQAPQSHVVEAPQIIQSIGSCLQNSVNSRPRKNTAAIADRREAGSGQRQN
jgi:hypothetical protein